MEPSRSGASPDLRNLSEQSTSHASYWSPSSPDTSNQYGACSGQRSEGNNDTRSATALRQELPGIETQHVTNGDIPLDKFTGVAHKTEKRTTAGVQVARIKSKK
ncbi:hypothetical protein LTR28_009007, partial [Elasticomyces elasticus]